MILRVEDRILEKVLNEEPFKDYCFLGELVWGTLCTGWGWVKDTFCGDIYLHKCIQGRLRRNPDVLEGILRHELAHLKLGKTDDTPEFKEFCTEFDIPQTDNFGRLGRYSVEFVGSSSFYSQNFDAFGWVCINMNTRLQCSSCSMHLDCKNLAFGNFRIGST